MSSPSTSAPACNAVLLPLAVCAAMLWAFFSLAPLTPSGLDWKLALSGLLDSLGEGLADAFAMHLLMALPLGFLWQGVFWPRGMAGRLAASAGVLLGLLALSVLVAWGQSYFKPGLVPPGGLLGTLLGGVAGMGLWWGGGAALMRRLPPLPGGLWPGMVLFAMLLWALPLAPDRPLGDPALAQGAAVVTDLPQRFYQLIKGAMLWMPAGFILALAGQGAVIPRWGMALVVAPLLVGTPVLGTVPLRDMLELAAALPGLWLGAWLGEQTRLSGADEARGAGSGHRPERGPETVAAPKPKPKPEAVTDEGAPSRGRRRARPHPADMVLGAGLLVLALIGVFDFSRWQAAIGLGLVLYAGALWRWPSAWLVVVPATLPLLDLAPWTVRFFLDEFDMVMLVTAGMLLLRGVHARPQPLLPGAVVLMTLFGISLLVSLFTGLLPMPAMDANAFSSYWSPYNSLRIAKGMAWGGLIFLWVRRSGLDMDVLGRRMAVGMGVGLLGVGLVGVWEHWLFAGQSNGTYRIFSTFSSMHTGGGHIEAYLAAAVPFLWLFMGRWRELALSGPLLLLTTLAMLYTVARGGLLALGGVAAILVVASIRLAGARRAIMPVTLMLAVALALGVGAGGGYLQQRLAQTGQDWQIRVDHWALALGLRDDSALTSLFGMGLGSFPRAYLQRGPLDKQSGTYAFAREGDNTYLRLGGGDTLYYAQRVDVKGGRDYRLELDARAEGAAARIETPVCEKQLLNSRRCVWLSFDVPGDGQWHRLSRSFSSADVGHEPAWRRPPVEMFLYMPVKGGVMAVDNLHLIGPDGPDLLCNGDFGRGGDCWFFKTHSHLPWHIKNLWTHVLFEQGWVGLLLFLTLTILAIYRLAKAGWRGHRLAWTWLASLAGLLTVGMFDSLLDAPRLATLLMAWTFIGAGSDWDARSRSRRRHGAGIATAPEALGRMRPFSRPGSHQPAQAQ